MKKRIRERERQRGREGRREGKRTKITDLLMKFCRENLSEVNSNGSINVVDL